MCIFSLGRSKWRSFWFKFQDCISYCWYQKKKRFKRGNSYSW